MEPFVFQRGLAAPIDAINLDTDQILPARFLRKRRSDPEYKTFLFHDLRFDPGGNENQKFTLNQEAFRGATIIVGNSNFGGGSSREAAVFALEAYGIRSVIAPNFGDIFYNNCLKNGLLPIVLTKPQTDQLRKTLHQNPGSRIDVDLNEQRVSTDNGITYAFEINDTAKKNLMSGLGQIGLTMMHAQRISEFEARYNAQFYSEC